MNAEAEIFRRYLEIRERISAAQERGPRSAAKVQLVAVSKRQPVESMLALEAALSSSGAWPVFGESTLQEYDSKRRALSGKSPVHFIGRLQSNKAKRAVELFDVIESVASEKLVALIDREAAKLGKRQKIFLQVNISDDEAKSGFSEAQVEALLCGGFVNFAHLELCGLMTITRFYEQVEAVRPDFARFYDFRERLMRRGDVVELLQGRKLLLSMGMSQDFEIAVEEGADLVRVGTALFGERRLLEG